MEQDKYEIEAKIFKGIKENDNEVLSPLYKNYYFSTTYTIKREGGRKEDQEDIFQEAIIIFIKKIRTDVYLYEEGKMGGYIRGIVMGLWRNHQRRKKAEQLTDAHVDQHIYDGEDEIMNTFENEARQKLFNRLLHLLSEKCKAIILGRYRNEYSDAELALQWNYADRASLKQGRSHCLKKLKKKVFENGPVY